MRDWKKAPKDGRSRFENSLTQPLRTEKIFANPATLTQGWYPLCRARELRKGEAKSFLLSRQRLAVWRTETGALHALDAFCTHMGADLGNGAVVGEGLRCYFHHRTFGADGRVTCPREHATRARGKLKSYPVREHLGYLWLFAGEEVLSPLIPPAGLEGQPLDARHFLTTTLFAHHHVMMAGGLDLLHFSSVHKIDIDFQLEHRDQGEFVYDWKMTGEVNSGTLRGRLARLLLGGKFGYTLRVGGGSMVALTYGENQKLFGRWSLPALHMLWGCVPEPSGVSRVVALSVTARGTGLRGWLGRNFRHALTLFLVSVLHDDDVKAFPYMRFQAAEPLPADRAVLQLIHLLNQLPESPWTKLDVPLSPSVSNIGLQITN